MSAGHVEGGAMRADERDFTPREDEVLNPPDVYRCERARDVADRGLVAAVDAVVNLAPGFTGAGRVAFVCAHMLTFAIAYAADCLKARRSGDA